MKRIGGTRRKTRSKFRKNVSDRGKISIRRYLQSFKQGDKVSLVAEPAVQKGMYFRRFHGLVGTVEGKQGSCYLIKIHDRHKQKQLIVHAVHLRRVV